MTGNQHADRIEEALQAQAAYYREQDDALDKRFVFTGWIGISAWSGIVGDGDEASAVVVHLRDNALPDWQLIGLLRRVLIRMEAAVANPDT